MLLIISKAEKFKSETSKSVKSLKNTIREVYDLTTIVDTLKQFYFAKNLPSPTRRSNKLLH